MKFFQGLFLTDQYNNKIPVLSLIQFS